MGTQQRSPPKDISERYRGEIHEAVCRYNRRFFSILARSSNELEERLRREVSRKVEVWTIFNGINVEASNQLMMAYGTLNTRGEVGDFCEFLS